eukprot:scaffold18569_cov42-Attheya_sp.AAC.2
MATEAAALPGAITIGFLRSFPALADLRDEQLEELIVKLATEWITSTDSLDRVSRSSLLGKLPALALDALKPEQQNGEFNNVVVAATAANPTQVPVVDVLAQSNGVTVRFGVDDATTASHATNELAAMYDKAETVPEVWLPKSPQNVSWTGNWHFYSTTDAQKKETAVIQPAINNELEPNFPLASPYVMKNTSSGWQTLTQDATLFLKDCCEVELTAAAIFEWVGQDESPFPSKKHEGKFIRDCMRLNSRCGGDREVHGIITDLSRIVVLKLVGTNDDGSPHFVKTPTFEGAMVRTILTQFAFATPDDLGFRTPPLWRFANYTIDAGKVFGTGLHGKAFSVANDSTMFVKTFSSASGFESEATALRVLNAANVDFVPRLLETTENTGVGAILASPVCTPLETLQGRSIVWVLGQKLVDCLENVHNAGLCHRDKRPSNMGYYIRTAPLLFDWASAANIGSSPEYVGTVHYAAYEVLEIIKDSRDPVLKAAHDLESLVYSIYDVSKEPATR